MRTQTPYAFRTSQAGALEAPQARFTADAELVWPKIERKPTVMHRAGREALILPVTNSIPLDAELEPVSTGPTHIAAPVARVDELKAALWGSAHRSHTASMPRSQDPINAAGHRAVTWVGAVLTVALLSAIAMGVL